MADKEKGIECDPRNHSMMEKVSQLALVAVYYCD
jgi:hypothetical protein